jgi:sodium-dependent dicarboxylate transporter 2/3/5
MQEAIQKIKTDKAWTRKMLTAVVIYVLFQFILPAPAPITKSGMGVAGIFIATLYLWITAGIGWTSILCVGMMGTTGVCSASDLFAKTWGNSMVPFVVACFLLNIAMAETGFTRRFAMWFITRKICKGKPWRIMFMLFLSCVLIGLVSTSSPIVILYMAIAEEMFLMTGYQKGDELPKATMISIFWMAQGAMFMTPISHVLIPAIFGYMGKDFGVDVTYAQFSSIFMLCGLIWFAVFWLIFRFLMKPDVEKMANLDIDALRASVPKISPQEIIAAVVYGIVIIVWLCPDLFSAIGLTVLGKYMKSLGTAVPAMVAVGVLAMIRVDNKPVLDVPKACKSVAWGSVFMMAAVMGTAYLFGLKTCGVTSWLGQTFGPAMSHMSPPVFVIFATAWIVIMTNLMSNTLTSSMYAVLVPIAMTVSGVNPIAIALVIASACNAAFATPSSCPAASLASGAGWTPAGYQGKYGWILAAATLIIMAAIGYPLCNLMFPYSA